MDVIAGGGVGHLEAGIVDAVASLRGAGVTGFVVEGYDHYNGGTGYDDSHFVAEDPEGTAGTEVQEFVLDAAVVHGSTWSSFPRADFAWASLVTLRRWDVRKVGVIGYARPKCADVVRSRYMERSGCRFQIPSDIRCDRTFLEHARDEVYVKEMSEWLSDGGATMPLLRMDAIRNVVVGERGMREWKTSVLMRMGSGGVISFEDYFCFRGMEAHETDVRFCGRLDDRTTMLVPFYDFRMVPPVVAGVVPPLSLAVRLPRVAHYFANTEKSEGPEVSKRYERAYVVEWAYAIAAALGLDVEVFRRVWICDTECIAFLRQFVSFSDVFVDYIDYGVARVSFKTLVDVLEKARVLTPEFVSYRMDYATRKRSPYAKINEVTQGFIRVGASELLRPVVRSSQEVFDTVFADAVYRQDPAWESALTGFRGRSEGWRVRDVIEVLVGRVNRYYREKESAEFDVDTLRARFSMIGGYERGLKRHRRSDDEEKDGGSGWTARDPYD